MAAARIQSLYQYPVKSCAPFELQCADITASGIAFDRRWMIVDSITGKFITQRKYGVLARIRATVISDIDLSVSGLTVDSAESIVFQHLDNESLGKLIVPIIKHNLIATEVWGDQPNAWDQGDEIADWLSSVLDRKVRLAYIDDSQLRQVDEDYANKNDRVGFADGFPFLIATTASIAQFNQDLGYDISITRFRPNIVIEGEGILPYQEDEWKQIVVNGIVFEIVKPCSRCVMPSVNPETGERERKVIETLVATRKQGNATYFGQNAVHSVTNGRIAVGDSVEVVFKSSVD